ncbi:hypothetical protein ACRRTK_016394 [Alexandromys fortis]
MRGHCSGLSYCAGNRRQLTPHPATSQLPPPPPSQKPHVLGSLPYHPAHFHLHSPPPPTHSSGPCPQELQGRPTLPPPTG